MNAALSLAEMPEVATRPKLTLNWRGKTEPVPDIAFVDVTEELAPPSVRVERVLVVAPPVELTPLQICLTHWRDWMHQSDRDLSAKGQAGLMSGPDEDEDKKDRAGYDDSAAASEAAAARASRDIAMATDAMIDSLLPHLKEAIYRSCSIIAKHAVWRFKNASFMDVLPDAQEALAEKLSKNVATRAFF